MKSPFLSASLSSYVFLCRIANDNISNKRFEAGIPASCFSSFIEPTQNTRTQTFGFSCQEKYEQPLFQCRSTENACLLPFR